MILPMNNKNLFMAATAAVAAVVVLVLLVPAAYAARATVKPLSVPSGTVSAGVPIVVRWQATNFPANGRLDINVVRQVSQTPRSFVLVRRVAQGVANTGSITWTPSSGDVGSSMFLQIGC